MDAIRKRSFAGGADGRGVAAARGRFGTSTITTTRARGVAPARRRFARLTAACLALVGSAAVLPDHGFAQEGRREVEAGNRLYEEGKYSEAHARYLEALKKAPGLPLARFNEGNALYQSQEFQRAMQAYMDALENGDPEWRSRAWYNVGNALVRQQQPGAAVEAYKESLRLDPSDGDAKHNLEMALMQLEQQQQQQDQSGDSNEEQEQQDEDQEGQQGQGRQDRSEPQEQQDEGEGGAENESPRDQPEEGRRQDEPEEEEGDGQAGRAPGEMTPEQAERLLQAINEDPGEVNRKAAQARGRRPRKDW